MRSAISTALTTLMIGIGASGAAYAGSLDGTWSGAGKVILKNGSIEPVRCHIRYEADNGKTVVLHANCSHANGIFKQSGRIVKRSNVSYTGHMYSDQFGVAGDVRIAVNGNRQTLTAVSPQGRASVQLSKR